MRLSDMLGSGKEARSVCQLLQALLRRELKDSLDVVERVAGRCWRRSEGCIRREARRLKEACQRTPCRAGYASLDSRHYRMRGASALRELALADAGAAASFTQEFSGNG